MNVLQALAVAAAALAISGDPWCSYATAAGARLTSFVAHSEILVTEFVTDAAEHALRRRCAERAFSNAPLGDAKHGLPDASIHNAAGAARL